MEYILTQDNDSHWYVIPSNKTDEWLQWEESEDYELGIIPEWANPINGCYTQVKFKEYRIGN